MQLPPYFPDLLRFLFPQRYQGLEELSDFHNVFYFRLSPLGHVTSIDKLCPLLPSLFCLIPQNLSTSIHLRSLAAGISVQVSAGELLIIDNSGNLAAWEIISKTQLEMIQICIREERMEQSTHCF